MTRARHDRAERPSLAETEAGAAVDRFARDLRIDGLSDADLDAVEIVRPEVGSRPRKRGLR